MLETGKSFAWRAFWRAKQRIAIAHALVNKPKLLLLDESTGTMLKAGVITYEKYDRWHYRYPKFDITQR